MDYKRIRQSGQAALEYMLLLTVVAVVIFIALKPSPSSPTILNKAHNATEGYYNTVTEAIMGRNPRPINGGLCPPKPNGEQECACPQPAFGGTPCFAPSGIMYCGDGICNGSETAQPGSPNSCFEDCGYLPDCGNCGNMIPQSVCGGPCPTVNCLGVEVCMSSDCPAACPGYTQACQPDAVLCSGACACNPGSWVALGACGVTSGTCVPTWLEMCFQNTNCNTSCTPAQTIRAMADPTCGQCVAAAVPIACGTGSVTFPATLNGAIGTVACPAGCVPGNTSARCTDTIFGVPSPPCIPDNCSAFGVTDPDCGNATLPATTSGNISQVLCPNFCGGTFSAQCNAGGFGPVTDACIPRPCPATPMATANCGGLTLPAVGNGVISTAPSCPAGCTGSYSARCSNASFVAVADACFLDCPAWTTPTAQCGNVTIPGTTHGVVSTAASCPAGCTGSPPSATCGNGTFFSFSDPCLPSPCAALPVTTASCGGTTLPGTTSGSVSSIACPGGCTGTVSATCSFGAFGPVSDGCAQTCPATPINTGACGIATLPGTNSGNSSSVGCPGGCTGGPISALCTNGTFGAASGSCLANCPATVVNTGACGIATLPGTTSGNSSSVGCPGGCPGGPVSALCTNGSFGATSGTCLAPCSDTVINTGACGNTTLLGTTSGNTQTAGCPGGCTGGPISAVCTNGSFGATSGSCTLPIYVMNYTVAATIFNFPNDQSASSTTCFATNISTVLSINPPAACGNPGTPSSSCTVTVQ